MKNLLLLLVLIGSFTVASAQQRVGTAIGLRFGSPTSVSAKHFFTDEAAIEVMVGFRPHLLHDYNNTFLGAAYQHHMPLDFGDSDFASLHWYIGAGGSFQFWNYNDDYFFGTTRLRNDYSRASVRVAGYLGLQYALEDFPVEFTVDWSPSVEIGNTPYSSLRFGFYTLGVRYILN